MLVGIGGGVDESGCHRPRLVPFRGDVKVCEDAPVEHHRASVRCDVVQEFLDGAVVAQHNELVSIDEGSPGVALRVIFDTFCIRRNLLSGTREMDHFHKVSVLFVEAGKIMGRFVSIVVELCEIETKESVILQPLVDVELLIFQNSAHDDPGSLKLFL